MSVLNLLFWVSLAFERALGSYMRVLDESTDAAQE